jgi:ATP-binding cassette subfamily B protein
MPPELEESTGGSLRGRELGKLLRYLCAYPALLWGGFFLVLLATAASLLEPRLFGFAIDEAIIPASESRLATLVGVFLGVELIRVLAMIGQSYCFTLLGQRVMQDLRMALLSRLQSLPVATFDKNPAGKLVTRVTNDISSLAEMFSAGFVTIVTNLLTVLGTLIWLLILDSRLALVSLAVFPVLVGFSVYFSSQLRVAYREARSRLSGLNSFLAENIMGIRIVQLFTRETRQLERFGRVNEAYTQAQIGAVRVFAFFQPSITWASGIAVAVAIGVGGSRAYRGEIPVGVLVAFLTYVFAVFQPIREIADKWNLFLSGMASAERIFSILQWPIEHEGAADAALVVNRSKLPSLRGEIEFQDVWFSYVPDHWVLQGVSFRISAGARVGIVGHTGAGKSTIISLLMRFYDPQRGRILLDGRDLREYDRRELRARIGWIQQEVFLFSGSMRENLELFRVTTSDQPVVLPEGLVDQELYERGVNLSMGQRQRLAFYRARLSEPDLWILDEATAHVDSTTEQELSSLLRHDAAGKTQILVAHRLSTIRDADQILVLHQGRLVEQGRHHELVARGEIYAKLVELQSFEERQAAHSAQTREGVEAPSSPA